MCDVFVKFLGQTANVVASLNLLVEVQVVLAVVILFQDITNHRSGNAEAFGAVGRIEKPK